MATWKKVLVSGSSINAATLQVDNLNYGEVVVGGGTGSALYTIPINGTGSLLATTGSSGVSISGSFSGSFFGDGSGLTNLTLDGAKIATGSVTASVNTTGDVFKVQSSSVELFVVNENGAVEHGNAVTASGVYSHAQGQLTQATGLYSHAEGVGTVAIGAASHAEGLGTIASGSYQTVVGKYNTQGNTDSLFVVGSGVSDGERSDVALFNSASVVFNAPISASELHGTASWAVTASYVQSAVSSSYPFSISGSTIYSNTGEKGQFSTNNAFFVGLNAGQSASFSGNTVFIGQSAGRFSTNASFSNFIGNAAGFSASRANASNFIGQSAGNSATDANTSNFIGLNAGSAATNANNSNYVGQNAGQNAINADHSNFLGRNAGQNAVSASNSIFIGRNAGRAVTTGSSVGSNNIVIGTNITLETNRVDSINFGGLIFGTGSYSNFGTNPFSGSANGKIGINQPNPEANFDVSGSGRFTNGLVVTGSLIAPDITGSLFGTASWAFNSISASYASQSLTASFALTASGIEPAIINNISGSLLFSTGTGKIEGAPSMSWDGAKLTIDGNAKITGDLTVQGTASFENQTSLVIADRFVLLASGSNSLTDGGIIIAKGGNSGSALYLESTSTGADGRWAVTAELDASASAATPDSFVVTAKINQSTTASGAPTWGGSTNGAGNIWITNDGDIYIYA